MPERNPRLRKPGCIYKHPHPDHECRNQDDMRDPADVVDALTNLLADVAGEYDRPAAEALIEAVRSEAYSEGYSDGIAYADASR